MGLPCVAVAVSVWGLNPRFCGVFTGPLGAEFVQSELGFAPNTPGFGGKGRSGVVLVFLALLCVLRGFARR